MASPIAVTTTPTLLIGSNIRRDKVQFQNNGREEVFIKKWPPGAPAPLVSQTNYDFILAVRQTEEEEREFSGDILQITSISAFVAVSESGTCPVGVMETVKVAL
jgi:hypothetical protein